MKKGVKWALASLAAAALLAIFASKKNRNGDEAGKKP